MSSMLWTALNIDGKECDASTGQVIEVTNPLERTVTSKCASATVEDVQRACDVAAAAFEAWEKTPLPRKSAILNKAADLLDSEEYRKKLLDAQRTELAMTIENVMVGITIAVNYFRYAASLRDGMQGSYFESDRPGGQVIVQRRAAGVVFSATPWNAPIALSARALAVPLFAGNTTVLKASEFAPYSTYLVCEALWKAGLPKGVLNLVTFSRENAAACTEAAIAHPAVRRITFTGSDIVGKRIASIAGKHLKLFIAELGGKNATIVLEDADLEAAARAIVFSSNLHSGQICMGTERVIAHRAVVDKLTSLLKHHISKLRAGKGEKLSSLFSDAAAQNVISHIEDAQKNGAKIEVGDGKRDGAVVQPHLLSGVKPTGKSWTEETFGPITSITTADSDEHAIELHNDTEYTLTAALWTKDLHKAMTLAPRMRSGTTIVNGPSIHTEMQKGNVGLGGRSGYLRFELSSFTDERTICFLPPNQDYILSQPIATQNGH